MVHCDIPSLMQIAMLNTFKQEGFGRCLTVYHIFSLHNLEALSTDLTTHFYNQGGGYSYEY